MPGMTHLFDCPTDGWALANIILFVQVARHHIGWVHGGGVLGVHLAEVDLDIGIVLRVKLKDIGAVPLHDSSVDDSLHANHHIVGTIKRGELIYKVLGSLDLTAGKQTVAKVVLKNRDIGKFHHCLVLKKVDSYKQS